jgi:hypothetical protein
MIDLAFSVAAGKQDPEAVSSPGPTMSRWAKVIDGFWLAFLSIERAWRVA